MATLGSQHQRGDTIEVGGVNVSTSLQQPTHYSRKQRVRPFTCVHYTLRERVSRCRAKTKQRLLSLNYLVPLMYQMQSTAHCCAP
jgi:hypothetical protein